MQPLEFCLLSVTSTFSLFSPFYHEDDSDKQWDGDDVKVNGYDNSDGHNDDDDDVNVTKTLWIFKVPVMTMSKTLTKG